jgi:uncharacterized tellurite resistance protein B-like protein
MGFFKCLAYVAGGVGAVVLAPMTGGSSLALAIGAMGTTTAAGVAIGAGIGATAAAIDHAATAKDEAYIQGVAEGTKAGERSAQQKYEKKVSELTQRLISYHDTDSKLVAMYAIGLAVANADGNICNEEREELDAFICGCMAGKLPSHIKKTIADLSAKPPTLKRAIEFARNVSLPKQDIDDIIDIVANADGQVVPKEQVFIEKWQQMSEQYEFA